ncbi:hypothetical protein [Tropicimonas marinistellae]|uniref:hypothetical protein n=1 Tax=Tropicimonas marinistellae TaxID=1739787 RepID=UPI0008374154|nr:hypothetical protein [Tropicimonas marinistellae]
MNQALLAAALLFGTTSLAAAGTATDGVYASISVPGCGVGMMHGHDREDLATPPAALVERVARPGPARALLRDKGVSDSDPATGRYSYIRPAPEARGLGGTRSTTRFPCKQVLF